MHEAQMHPVSCFVTLTYNDKYFHPSLNYSDFQRFMRRLRKVKRGVRFFMCGEYGALTQRPHFHALLFNCSFSNLSPVKDNLYRSTELEKLWPFGFSSIGSVTYESAGYVASYSCSKVVGPKADAFYTRCVPSTGELVRVVPEFARMSLKPGIGEPWFRKYWREVYGPRDGVVRRGGLVSSPPRFYDKLLERMAGGVEEMDCKRAERYRRSGLFVADNTTERLQAREAVALAALSRKRERRSL